MSLAPQLGVEMKPWGRLTRIDSDDMMLDLMWNEADFEILVNIKKLFLIAISPFNLFKI